MRNAGFDAIVAGLYVDGHDVPHAVEEKQFLAIASPARSGASLDRNLPFALAGRQRLNVHFVISRFRAGESEVSAVGRELARITRVFASCRDGRGSPA